MGGAGSWGGVVQMAAAAVTAMRDVGHSGGVVQAGQPASVAACSHPNSQQTRPLNFLAPGPLL